jgi:hypothetical protein
MRSASSKGNSGAARGCDRIYSRTPRRAHNDATSGHPAHAGSRTKICMDDGKDRQARRRCWSNWQGNHQPERIQGTARLGTDVLCKGTRDLLALHFSLVTGIMDRIV